MLKQSAQFQTKTKNRTANEKIRDIKQSQIRTKIGIKSRNQ